MNVVFVTTFASLHSRVLPLLETLDDALVVTGNPNIYKFFVNFTDYDIIKTGVHPNLFTRKTWFLAPINAIRARVEYNKLFRDIKDSTVYFFGSAWTITLYYYIQKLAKNNKVYQHISTNRTVKQKIVKNKLATFAIKLLLGLDTIIIEDGGIQAFELSAFFYAKNNISVVKNKMYTKSLKNYVNKLNLDGKSILLVTEDAVAYNRVDEKEYTKSMNNLCTFLQKYCPNQSIIKSHPNSPKVYGNLNQLPKIPSYIPSEFLMSHPWKYIIGTESMTLIEATEKTDAKVISLLYVLPYLDAETQSDFRKFFDNATKKILFPKDMFDFGEIMDD